MQRVAVGLAVDGDRANAEFPAGVQYAQRDFAAIGNQNFTKHSCLLNGASSAGRKKGLPKLDGLAVGNKTLDDFAGGVGFDLVHQLHGLDDADDLALLDVIAGETKGAAPGEGEP